MILHVDFPSDSLLLCRSAGQAWAGVEMSARSRTSTQAWEPRFTCFRDCRVEGSGVVRLRLRRAYGASLGFRESRLGAWSWNCQVDLCFDVNPHCEYPAQPAAMQHLAAGMRKSLFISAQAAPGIQGVAFHDRGTGGMKNLQDLKSLAKNTSR